MSAIIAPQPALNDNNRVNSRVRVFTASGIIEGEYAHLPGVRLSDSLRNASTAERYLVLTDVTIRALDGAEVHQHVGKAPFVLVNTAHASVIIPLEGE